jgi:hypothetical protein
LASAFCSGGVLPERSTKRIYDSRFLIFDLSLKMSVRAKQALFSNQKSKIKNHKSFD